MATKSKGNSNSQNYKLAINNPETIENAKPNLTVLAQAKRELFDTLSENFENTLVNRCQFAKRISDNRYENGTSHKNNGIPEGEIIVRDEPNKLTVNISKKIEEYKDEHGVSMKDQYEKLIKEKPEGYENELKKLDSMLAERCILDEGGAIEFKKGDKDEDIELDPKDESLKAFEGLNKLDEYKGKIEVISQKKPGIDHYVIKRTEEQTQQIKEKYKEKYEEWQKKHPKKNENPTQNTTEENNEEKDKEEQIGELKEKLEEDNNENKEGNDKVDQEKNRLKYNEKQIQLLEQENAILEVQLGQMSGNIGGFVMVEGHSIKITEELIESTKRQIELNKKKINELKGGKDPDKNPENTENNEDNNQGSTETNDDDDNNGNQGTMVPPQNNENDNQGSTDDDDNNGNQGTVVPPQNNENDNQGSTDDDDNNGNQGTVVPPQNNENDDQGSTDDDDNNGNQGTVVPPQNNENDNQGSTDDDDNNGNQGTVVPPQNNENDNQGSTDDGEGSIDDDNPKYEQREWVATISNVSQINRAIAQREADEELRQRYSDTSRFNFIGKSNLFLRRKFIKDRLVNKKMGGRRGMDWSEASQAAADRHQIEEQNNLAERMQVVISDIDAANYPETRRRLDDLLGRLTGRANTVPPRQREISDNNFQTEFQNILNMSGKIFDRTRPGTATSTNWRPMSEIIRSNNIGQLSTNILMQANKFREQQFLTWSIADHIANNPLENEGAFDTYCRNAIKQYINTYNDMPDFLEQTGIKLDDADATKEIKRLQAHSGALTMIAAQSLKIRIQMLNDGGEAYNVRKEGGILTKIGRFLDDPTGGENTKFGRWMNQHQNLKEAFGWIRGGAKIGMMMTPALLLAPVGPLAVATGVGGMSFLTTLVKKKAHFERENRSYQRMQATNLTDYRNKRAALANEVAGMHRYEGRFWGEKARVRKQYKDYVLTTQDQLSLSPDLLSRIERRLQDTNALNSAEQLNLAADLADGLARLDYHKRSGQNFLGSNNPGDAEREYRALQNAVMGGAKRLGIQVNDLRTTSPYDAYYNNTITLIEDGTGDEFDTQGYLRARKRFKNRSNTKAWTGAFKAGAISFGLSYLASSLASGNKTTTHETTTNMSHGHEGGEYNLGDAQEHLFVSGDVNPTMNSVITGDTQQITGATIYSSVDSVPCSVAKGAHELGLANADLSSTFSSSPFASNSAWISAKNNFITEAHNSIRSIPGVSEGNRQLALARAIEGWNEGILKPAIASGNSSMLIDPTAIHWVDGGIQNATGAVGQGFRNMGIVNLDFVQKGTEEVVEQVTRAIPIPVGLNTFGSPKSDPHNNKSRKQKDNAGKKQAA